jgi:hypothetical protein
MQRINRSTLPRRQFLKGSGTALALPWLETMCPMMARSASHTPETPRRMIAIQTNMGILPRFFFPKQTGSGYEASEYLKRLAEHKKQFTVFSGVSLPGVTGGHAAQKCFLTGTPHPERGGFRNGISLDQAAAEELGHATRYPSLVLAVTNENATLSYTRSGAPLPAERSPRALFERLFLQGNPTEVEARVEALRQGRSTLDFVDEQAKRLNRSVSKGDQQRLDQYFTSVRELERRMLSAQEWEYKPKPKTDANAPNDITDGQAFVERSEQMYAVMKLALETDSTRFISLFIDTTVIHNITHHGNRPEVLAELKAKELAQFDALNGFLTSLTETKEGDATLLDQSMVLYGTCMGSANSHSNHNLPVLLAGGGFKHGQHLAFDKENNYPLSNLYLTMLHRLGLESDAFSSSTGSMTGLDMA